MNIGNLQVPAVIWKPSDQLLFVAKSFSFAQTFVVNSKVKDKEDKVYPFL